MGDAPQAGRKALAISQRMYDFVTARTACTGRPDKLARGREASLDPNERKDEAPPWPASKDGYVRFNDVIADAASPEGKEAFWGWAETPTDADAAATEALRQPPRPEIPDAPPRIPNARIVCPAGAIAMPPLYVAAPARKSKSVPMITVIGIALQIPGAVVAVSIAPNKIGPLTELIKKVEKTGWTEAGIAIIASTLGASLGRNADPAATIRNFHASNLFFYSHEEAQDINAFVAWAEHKIAAGPRHHLGPRRGRHPHQEAARPRRAADGQGARDPAAVALLLAEQGAHHPRRRHAHPHARGRLADGVDPARRPARRGRRSLRRGHPDPAARADRPGAAVHRHRALRGGAVRRGGPQQPVRLHAASSCSPR